MESTSTVGERFARALGTKDASALLELLAPDVDFRGMTPNRVWEADSAATLVHEVIFSHWFTPRDEIVAIESLDHSAVVDRERVGYRFRVANDDGAFIVDQQAYLDTEGERITWLRIMCSGYRRWSG